MVVKALNNLGITQQRRGFCRAANIFVIWQREPSLTETGTRIYAQRGTDGGFDAFQARKVAFIGTCCRILSIRGNFCLLDWLFKGSETCGQGRFGNNQEN
jgi:hypothetical protein